jgi:WD40 repeat protein
LAKTWQGHANAIMALAISPDRQYLATGNEDQTVKLWQMETGKVTHTLRGHTNRVWSVAFSPAPSTERSMPTLHSSPLTSHSALPPLLATSSADRTIKLWNPQTGECLRTLRGHQGWVWSIAFHPQGKYLVSGSYDHTLRLWNPNTGECLKTLKGHQASVVCVAFSPDGKTIASSSFDTTIRLWNAETGKCIQTLKGHEHSIWSIAFHPQGKYLVSGSYDKTVKLWDTQSGHCISTFTGHTHPIVCGRFSPDGKYLASGSFDRTIHLWEPSSGQRLQVFKAHQQPISSLCWDVLPSHYIQAAQGNSTINSSLDPSAMTLISSSFDETLKFWDITNGKCWQTWRERRPYDRMNITEIQGMTEAQKATLIALGAIEA